MTLNADFHVFRPGKSAFNQTNRRLKFRLQAVVVVYKDRLKAELQTSNVFGADDALIGKL